MVNSYVFIWVMQSIDILSLPDVYRRPAYYHEVLGDELHGFRQKTNLHSSQYDFHHVLLEDSPCVRQIHANLVVIWPTNSAVVRYRE